MKLLASADFFLYPPKEIAIAGPLDDDGVSSLLDVARTNFIPNKIIAHINPAQSQSALVDQIPLLANKNMIDNTATAYVCKNFACKKPVTTSADLFEQLEITPGE